MDSCCIFTIAVRKTPVLAARIGIYYLLMQSKIWIDISRHVSPWKIKMYEIDTYLQFIVKLFVNEEKMNFIIFILQLLRRIWPIWNKVNC